MISYDELYIVSDLHLGGEAGFQIFDQGSELAGLIKFLRGRPKERRIGFVLNGDVFDFLAEPSACYLDPVGVTMQLNRIVKDEPAFSMVWEELARFVEGENRELIFVLGNHDVELAFPSAKDYLLEQLCKKNTAARGQIIFATDGAGFACQVKGRNILCVHGNEVDTWNLVDYHQLLEVSRALNRANVAPEWTPNAGTRLVIDVMNGIKKTQPFVDLLKPETKVVPAVLLATESNIADKLQKLAPILLRLTTDEARHRAGFLSANGTEDQGMINNADAMQELLRPGFSNNYKIVEDDDTLFRRIEERFQQQNSSIDFKTSNNLGTLGVPGLVIDRILARDPVENLREALANWLGSDRTFDPKFEDDTFQRLDREIGADVDFIVAGHTHLHRSIKRKCGSGAYFNSGSWIRLIQIPPDSLTDLNTFSPIYDKLRVKTLKELDESGLILRRPTVVSIESIGEKVIGELRYIVLEPELKLEHFSETRQEM